MNVEPLGSLARTHTCGELTANDVGKDVVLLGWVHRVRDLGGVMFFDLRDRHGITQVVVRGAALEDKAKRLRPEYVVGIIGRVEARAKEAVNPKLKTGQIEIEAKEIRLLNDAKTPPFPINEDTAVSEEMRLRYRYLDLRRPRLQQNMILRHKAAFAVRRVLRRAGLPRDRNADPHQVHAGRRARLPGAEPRASRRVLRAAAVAADLQADPDDLRPRPLLPDREVLPRRGPARRPPAGVHAGRPRDLLRDREPRVLDPRTAHGTADGADRARRAGVRSARMPYAEAIATLRIRQARPAAGHGAAGPVGAVRLVDVLGLPRRDRGRRRSARLRDPERRRATRARISTT